MIMDFKFWREWQHYVVEGCQESVGKAYRLLEQYRQSTEEVLKGLPNSSFIPGELNAWLQAFSSLFPVHHCLSLVPTRQYRESVVKGLADVSLTCRVIQPSPEPKHNVPP